MNILNRLQRDITFIRSSILRSISVDTPYILPDDIDFDEIVSAFGSAKKMKEQALVHEGYSHKAIIDPQIIVDEVIKLKTEHRAKEHKSQKKIHDLLNTVQDLEIELHKEKQRFKLLRKLGL